MIVSRDGMWMRTRFLPKGVLQAPINRDHLDPGRPETAEQHYSDAAVALGLPSKTDFSRLDQLLALAGYDGLTAQHIAELDPLVLMTPAKLVNAMDADAPREFQAGDILATRFFSPKTTDVSGEQQPRNYSWRKLVRLRARPSSTAAKRGFISLWLLTNTYEADLDKNPFLTPNSNFQAILQPDLTNDNPPPMFFFVFDPLPEAVRVVASQASWDAGNELLGKGNVQTCYRPPTACIECHGRDTKFTRLQYLDTDHWIDRVQAKDDFPLVGQSKWPALFDAGRDPTDERFAPAFEVVRQLNREILQQNQAIDEMATRVSTDPKIPDAEKVAAKAALWMSFQTRATKNWLTLHNDSAAHFPPKQRGILGEDGETRWSATSQDEVKMVGLLNQFCFRCHSSVKFHVFDKQTVRDYYSMFAYNLDETLPHASLRMPQDRRPGDPVLTTAKRNTIALLAERIFEGPVATDLMRSENASPGQEE